MQGKIAFEEHVAIEETVGETQAFAGETGWWDAFQRQLLDTESERLEFMQVSGQTC